MAQSAHAAQDRPGVRLIAEAQSLGDPVIGAEIP
jgi:hypothetical protein